MASSATFDPAVRCWLFHGPDEAGSRAYASAIAAAVGADAERIDLTPAQLRADPALLADEAASASLFGEARLIRVDGAGEECLPAVDALLAAGAAGNPVVIVAAPSLKRDGKLAAAVEAHPLGRARYSKMPDERDAARIATTLGQSLGLRLEPEVARRLADACNADRAVIARELEKMALFLDAAPDRPRMLDADALEAIGIDAGEASLGRLLDAVFGGDERALVGELARAAAEGQEGITLIRAALRRALPLAAARAAMAGGAGAEAAAARHLFGRDRDAGARDLPRWPAARIIGAVERLGETERALKGVGGGAGPIAVEQLLLAMARAAAGRR